MCIRDRSTAVRSAARARVLIVASCPVFAIVYTIVVVVVELIALTEEIAAVVSVVVVVVVANECLRMTEQLDFAVSLL